MTTCAVAAFAPSLATTDTVKAARAALGASPNVTRPPPATDTAGLPPAMSLLTKAKVTFGLPPRANGARLMMN